MFALRFTDQPHRFVLAATEHLHRKISRLSDRIRLLEDALASVHGKTSNGIHPLLSEDLIISDDTLVEETEMLDDVLGATAAVGHAPDVIDAFGTLSISDHGISRFFGPTGGSEVSSFVLSASPLTSYQFPQSLLLVSRSDFISIYHLTRHTRPT